MRPDETYYLVILASAKYPKLHDKLWPALHEMAWIGREGEGNLLFRLTRSCSGLMELINIAYIDKEGELCTTGQSITLEEKALFRGWKTLDPEEVAEK